MEPDPPRADGQAPGAADRRARRSAMYGANDLSSLTLFSGGFINFGYWADPPGGPDSAPTVAERTASQQEMYRQVARRLDLGAGQRAAEVGCGLGVGAALVAAEFSPAALVALDLSAEQLGRARERVPQARPGAAAPLRFVQADADRLPLAEAALDAVYSVEAAQHFEDLPAFAAEARRVLRPGGRLAVAVFFLTAESARARATTLLETFGNGVDVVVAVDDFTAVLRAAGFTDVAAESIGPRVWHRFDAWIARTEYRDVWSRNWLRAYEEGLVDYYIATARR
ncbi:methyltransferase domain-containing protein [Streptomonospora sp. S1-112]|uniref:Methyltransferase domain-containing protein n=1 Tax=Streptomonospora mangrovi TaxID=2883123 RepID=A0A9X3SL24_9ACTN|nr:methyltransferase domain-containing protein [Streptomonospora mangrovi]MDA0563261.1 methyltransferase domain-containing protein [Streptomonospora mangrovi]